MGNLTLSQTDYISKVLKKFNMSSCKPVPTALAPHFKLSSHECPKSEEDKEDMSRVPYSSAVGSLMYVMVCTRLDLAHVVSVVSRYMHNTGKMHWEAVKCILRYLKGTSNIGLSFEKGRASPNGVVGYVDSDYAGDLDARKSLSSYIFSHCGSAISWYSSLQAITALSTTEAEYISSTEEKRCDPISVEDTVREIVWTKVDANSAMAAKLLRLHYHDCFVRGCDGSILLDSTQNVTTEKTAGPNRSITGYDIIDEIKSVFEASCPGIVSCVDIVALAARDAVSFQVRSKNLIQKNWIIYTKLGDVGSKTYEYHSDLIYTYTSEFQTDMWPVFTGRKDGSISLASEVGTNLPSANAYFTTLLSQFKTKGLDLKDLVTLSGAHTIGISRCALVARRLYDFTGIGDADPTLDETYAQTLRKLCPNPQNPATILEMDPYSSLSFDSNYYRALNQHKGLFVSDAALLTNSQLALIAEIFEDPAIFFDEFTRSMVRMGAIEVLTWSRRS
nr:peroxidase 24-like [Tanacetum cinerariifolium]